MVSKRCRGAPFWKLEVTESSCSIARGEARHGCREERARSQSPLDVILEAMKDVF